MEEEPNAKVAGPHKTRQRRIKIRKQQLFDFPVDFWSSFPRAEGANVISSIGDDSVFSKDTADEPDISSLSISQHGSCNTCSLQFASHFDLREHYQCDLHKRNLKRKLRNKPPLTEDEFKNAMESSSDSSSSSSESDESDENPSKKRQKGAKKHRPSLRLQFKDPRVEEGDGFIVVYKAALPDEKSMHSFASLGSWAVIMTGRGHFSGAIWGADGTLLLHKSFHRYTERKKQGGSQALADAAGGGRIKSAGASLRRYGEQALRQEVQSLLASWKEELKNVQCVFMRSSKRDQRDLLFWEGSPLVEAKEKGVVRQIPFQTSRAKLEEVKRVYQVLSTAVVSPISLIDADPEEPEKDAPILTVNAPKRTAPVPKPAARPKVPEQKGTSHLKKRKPKIEDMSDDESSESDGVLEILELVEDVAANKLAEVQLKIQMAPDLKTFKFGTKYFQQHEKLKTLPHGYGLVGIAAACCSLDVLEWLMLEGVPLAIGGSPYLVTKAKSVRKFFRIFWDKHPDLHDYAAAEIPSPLSESDLAATKEKEQAKRRREREKKREKAFLATEAVKPPAVRARETRAAAAEMRMLGNKCIVCKKSLEGIVPFERLAYKYCSLDHCQKHREILGTQYL